ncbi:MAG: amidohydrolase family protein [Gemmatimonadales bacterium]
MNRLALLLLVASPLVASAQAPVTAAADTGVALPIKPARTLRFTTDEGTWMSLDVSPDGRTIVFDLLGDLYTLPIAGGKATRITSGMAWDCMPRWSPDGRTIAFISDRDGGDNLWLVNPDGTGAHRITKEVDNALSSPAWTPDGQYLVVRRFGPYPSAENYLTNVPLWLYHKDGGAGTLLYPSNANTKSTNTGVAFSPDGRTMYVSYHGGGYSGENIGAYQVSTFDRATGETRPLTSAAGGALRPVASADGRWLVYVTRAGTRSALRMRDLKSQEDSWLVAEVQRDDQEGYAPNDVFPGYSFTPDSRAVVFPQGGKIRRVDLETKKVTTIPFSADVEMGMGARQLAQLKVDDGPLTVTQLMNVTESPDGRRIAFSAVGRLWTADQNGTAIGTPRRLTSGANKEYLPAYSPDGAWIAYVTWSDSVGGFLWKARADGSAAPVQLTREAAFLSGVEWSPEGDRIVYTAQPRQAGLGSGSVAPVGELRWVDAAGGEQHAITRSTSAPVLVTANAGGTARVFYLDGIPNPAPGFNATQITGLYSVRFDGTDKRTHARFTTMQALGIVVRVSPDQSAAIVIDRDDLYALPLTGAGADGLQVNFQSPSVPVRRITVEGANYVGWVNGGRGIAWSFANHYSHATAAAVLASPDSSRWGLTHAEVRLTVPRNTPSGRVLLRGARIVTMKGDEVIPRGDILIESNRIAQVGASVRPPAGTQVIDVSGKTIIPGIVDDHAHPKTGRELAQDQEWSIASNLAFGVTTTRNPSGTRWNVAWNELVETGEMIGSRMYATGFPLTSNNTPLKSYDDAVHAVNRYKAQGVNSIKQYLQPRRIQRQWVLEASRAAGMNATNEGAGDLKADIQMAIDGYTGLEHSIGQVPLYKDVVSVLADAKITWTPTLVVAYGGPAGDTYWRARTDLESDPKTAYFTPADLLYRQARRRPLIIGEDYITAQIARGVRDVVRAGGRAGLGSHGQQDGIGAHWELWMIQSGDMTPMEALRIATIYGAESIGYGADLGSIERGKLADLVVLNSNPLTNIRNSTDIRYVIKNGEVYDAMTLDRVWPSARKFPKPFWVKEKEELQKIR